MDDYLYKPPFMQNFLNLNTNGMQIPKPVSINGISDKYEAAQVQLQNNSNTLAQQQNVMNQYYAGLNTAMAKDYQDQLNFHKHYNNMLAGIGSAGSLGLGFAKMWQQDVAQSKALSLQKQNTLVQLAEQNTRWKAVATQANAKFAAMLGARAGSGRNAAAVSRAVANYNKGKIDTKSINETIANAKDVVGKIDTKSDGFIAALGYTGGIIGLAASLGTGYAGFEGFNSDITFDKNVRNFIDGYNSMYAPKNSNKK